MQTMPSKNRTSMMVTGVALLVMVVGLIAYGLNQRAKTEVPENDPMANLAQPENGNATQPGMKFDAAGPTPDQGMTEAAEASSDTESPAAAAMTADSARQTTPMEATPAMITLGTVPETHVVQPNETLYSISMKYYNDKIYAGDIEQLNGLDDPNMIMAGTELKLPRPADLGMGVSE